MTELTLRQREQALIDQISDGLYNDGAESNGTFVARDLGYPEHTKMHDFVRRLICDHTAKVIFINAKG